VLDVVVTVETEQPDRDRPGPLRLGEQIPADPGSGVHLRLQQRSAPALPGERGDEDTPAHQAYVDRLEHPQTGGVGPLFEQARQRRERC
jgi:hypothetical protein